MRALRIGGGRARARRVTACVPLLAALASVCACGGGGSAAGLAAPRDLTFNQPGATYRQDEAIAPDLPTWAGGPPQDFAVAPDLPAGLSLDPSTGTLSGTPTSEAAAADYVVTASNAAGSAQTTLRIAVGPPLPAAIEALAPGFAAQVILSGTTKLAKIALAPDGRVFFTEVDAGQVRVVDPVLGLLATPFATLDVLAGGHHGLLGLVLDPAFTQNGHVYVQATIPGVGMLADRTVVLRYTDVASVGTNETVVVDNLPAAPPGGINNGGELCFGTDGSLFVSIGDVQDPDTAQMPGSAALSGRILRYDVGSLPAQVPADNPTAGDPTWVLGLRNTFALAAHPTTGGLFGADNGPAADDELNFLAAGRNFGWGAVSPIPGAQVGYVIRNYQTVIVPTAMTWHDGTGWGAGYANNLFLASYDDQALRRFVMSGGSYTDVDSEEIFLTFALDANANKVLDVERDVDGSLYVATFTGIYRIFKIPD